MYDIIKTDISSSMMINVFVHEHYFKQETLYNFLKNNEMSEMQWKILFFQVLYTLLKITEMHGKFRHNELSLDNILVYKKTENLKDKTRYKINNVDFDLPNGGFEIKITNFHKSFK
jgi:hypothetical protein